MSKDKIMEKHYVTFRSPGTFFAESTTKEIDAWDIDKALEMAAGIKERYNAAPYGFYFTTRRRGPDDFNSKEIAQSPMYFFGGKVETIEELEARDDPSERILRDNMRSNGWDKMFTTTSGWKWTQPITENVVVLP